MPSKVTYWFGAGASVNALPLQENMKDRIIKMYYAIKEMNFDAHLEKDKIKRIFLDDLDLFMREIEGHASIDICFRRMYLQENENYEYFKKIYTAYLTLEQMQKKDDAKKDKPGVDNRYITFLANFLNKDLRLPDSFSVLTWNYDYQIICAAEKYFHQQGYLSIRRRLNIFANSVPNIVNGHCKIICLNGMIEFQPKVAKDEPRSIHNEINPVFNSHSVFKVLENYYNWVNNISDLNVRFTPSLTFSWETTVEESVRDFATREVSNTETLIIVGYSFPFFNRNIDKNLFWAMKRTIKNIYIQGKDRSDSEKILNKLISTFDDVKELAHIHKRNIVAVEGDEKEFFVPPDVDFNAD